MRKVVIAVVAALLIAAFVLLFNLAGGLFDAAYCTGEVCP